MAIHRATQTWNIAHLLDMPFQLPEAVLDALEKHVLPQADQWRAFGVFPPAVEAPVGVDRETRLMCAFGRRDRRSFDSLPKCLQSSNTCSTVEAWPTPPTPCASISRT